MHARQLAEFAAWIAVRSEDVVNGFDGQDPDVLQPFWMATQNRNIQWLAALKTFQNQPTGARQLNPWPALEVLMDEIVVAEILTRVWSAMLVAIAKKSNIEDSATMANRQFIDHLDVRNRVMRLMLAHQVQQSLAFNRMNLLRRSVEKWTDIFLSLLADEESSRPFAFDDSRFIEYRQEQMLYDQSEAVERVEILLRSMALAMRNQMSRWSANPDLNRRVLDGVIVCLKQDVFSAMVLPPSIAAIWREKSHTDTQILVERLGQLNA